MEQREKAKGESRVWYKKCISYGLVFQWKFKEKMILCEKGVISEESNLAFY